MATTVRAWLVALCADTGVTRRVGRGRGRAILPANRCGTPESVLKTASEVLDRVEPESRVTLATAMRQYADQYGCVCPASATDIIGGGSSAEYADRCMHHRAYAEFAESQAYLGTETDTMA